MKTVTFDKPDKTRTAAYSIVLSENWTGLSKIWLSTGIVPKHNGPQFTTIHNFWASKKWLISKICVPRASFSRYNLSKIIKKYANCAIAKCKNDNSLYWETCKSMHLKDRHISYSAGHCMFSPGNDKTRQKMHQKEWEIWR